MSFDSLSRVCSSILSDRIFDKIPVLATINNCVRLFQKIVYALPIVNSKSYYCQYIREKSALRSLSLCIPIFGQIGVYLYDRNRKKKITALLAKQNFEEAAKLGSKRAIVNLAKKYEIGIGVPQDRNKALELYIRAAVKGSTEGLLSVLADNSHVFQIHEKEFSNLLVKQAKRYERFIQKTSMFVMSYLDDLETLDQNNLQQITAHQENYRKIVKLCDVANLTLPSERRSFKARMINTTRTDTLNILSLIGQ